MIKSFYILAWFLLIAAVLVTAFAGTFDSAALVIFSLLTLGLVFAMALWSVITNTREIKTE